MTSAENEIKVVSVYISELLTHSLTWNSVYISSCILYFLYFCIWIL